MASLSKPIKITEIGDPQAPTVVAVSAGYIGGVAYVTTLDPSGHRIHPDSFLGHLARDPGIRFVLIEHPNRPLTEADYQDMRATLRGDVFLIGLSRGAQVMSALYRLIKPGQDGITDAGLLMISPVPSVNDLMPTEAKLTRWAERWHVPYWLGPPFMRLFGGLFVTRDYRRAMRQAGVESRIRPTVRSARHSGWIVATMRAMARHTTFGPPLKARGRVHVASVPGDLVVNLETALPATWASYPAFREHLVEGATGHGLLELDGLKYQPVLQEALEETRQAWGYPA